MNSQNQPRRHNPDVSGIHALDAQRHHKETLYVKGAM